MTILASQYFARIITTVELRCTRDISGVGAVQTALNFKAGISIRAPAAIVSCWDHTLGDEIIFFKLRIGRLLKP
jgi:hypothetical protein